MRLSIAVTHAPTPERKAMLSDLMETLDPGSDAFREHVVSMRVVSDDEMAGVWSTTKRALLWALDQPADHLLLLPDDSVACRDFIASCARACKMLTSSPIVFYTGHGYTKQAEKRGITWTRLERCEIGCLALLISIDLVAEFLVWDEKHFAPNYRHSDVRIESWAYLTGNYIYATEPSLVQHTGANQSLMGHNGHASHTARHFIGRDASADSIDFSLGLHDPAVSKAKMPVMYRKVIKNWP